MTGPQLRTPLMTRRELLQAGGLGFGTLALAALLQEGGLLAAGPDSTPATQGENLLPRPGHFPARARAVIMLMQNGGPSQMDLFDPKPELARYDGRTHDERVEMFQRGSEANRLLASPFRFFRRGQCGMDMSEVLPHLGAVAD